MGYSLQAFGYTLSNAEAQLFKKLLATVANQASSWSTELNALDTECGDGDCGTTLALGALGMHCG